MREVTLIVYRDTRRALHNWRGNLIDNDSGRSIARTAWVHSRRQAVLAGTTQALEQGYKVWFAGSVSSAD